MPSTTHSTGLSDRFLKIEDQIAVLLGDGVDIRANGRVGEGGHVRQGVPVAVALHVEAHEAGDVDEGVVLLEGDGRGPLGPRTGR